MRIWTRASMVAPALVLVFVYLLTPHAACAQTNRPPLLVGAPSTSVHARTYYWFRPWARDADGDPLQFRISNKPAWAKFDATQGRLFGTPTVAGYWPNVRISVTDGRHTIALPAFTLRVLPAPITPPVIAPPPSTPGTATVSWTPAIPAYVGTGSPEPSGYLIHYGRDPHILDQAIFIADPNETMHVFENLRPGRYYFAMRSVTTQHGTSPLSNIISNVVTAP